MIMNLLCIIALAKPGQHKDIGTQHSPMQENILAVVGPTTIDGPPVERKQERKVRGIGEGAANQRVR